MSAFLSDLITRIERPGAASRNSYYLTAPLVYESDKVGTLEVPAGFRTDFASIPRIAWRYIDPEDPCICYPSVIHDWLYVSHGTSREVADQVLREAMAVAGARLDQRAFVYMMVRMFGGSHWKPSP